MWINSYIKKIYEFLTMCISNDLHMFFFFQFWLNKPENSSNNYTEPKKQHNFMEQRQLFFHDKMLKRIKKCIKKIVYLLSQYPKMKAEELSN